MGHGRSPAAERMKMQIRSPHEPHGRNPQDRHGRRRDELARRFTPESFRVRAPANPERRCRAAKTPDEVAAFVAKRLDNLRAGVLRASTTRIGDPVEKAARAIAREKVLAAIAKLGVSPKGSTHRPNGHRHAGEVSGDPGHREGERRTRRVVG